MKNTPSDIGNYIAGFTDGEGSFNVSVKKRLDFRQNWKLSASFNISQKDRVILAWIKHVLRCGTLRSRKDGIVYYEVTNVTSLYTVILPFFKRFGFRSAYKKHNFRIFSEIVSLMHAGEHLTPGGFQKILELRENLNPGIGRKRKYTLEDVVNSEESPETTRKIKLSQN
ncbi:MAG: LAGLIDADG family homing endonuclease [Patescibacteria group bacterium]